MPNFDQINPRRGTNSYKWDSSPDPDVLPMWVADMDFQTAPAIVNALQKRVVQGIFGYTRVPQSYYEAVDQWFATRHQWQISPEWIIYTSGVVPAISAIIKALTRPGDKVIAQTPVYNCFFSSIRNNHCTLLSNPLRRVGTTYEIDFDDLERKAADPKARLLLLCNPHNPAGRVWKRDELLRVGEICARHDVIIVADEIHCELVMPGHTYTPFASLCDDFQKNCITCISPSKAFNIAGLQIANIVCADPTRRALIDRAINDNEVCDVNPFGVIATEAAYREGAAWLDALLVYLHDNYQYMKQFCQDHLPDFPLTTLEGTYLVWMNTSVLGINSQTLEERLRSEAHLWLNAGIHYGLEGKGFMRWNIACPRATLTEGLTRFAHWVKQL